MGKDNTKKKRILAVDDNDQMLGLVRDVLEMAGYDAITASSGREGLEYISSDLSSIDLLLVDMNIGDMSGPEFLNELEQSLPGYLSTTPAIFLSAAQSVPLTQAKGFIQKPFVIKSFLESIHSQLSSGR